MTGLKGHEPWIFTDVAESPTIQKGTLACPAIDALASTAGIE